MNQIPDWALVWKRKGTVLQMVGDLCCIYKTRSFRVKGMKNPRVEKTYLGVVTPDGVHVKVDVNIDNGGIDIFEAGFTDFVLDNVPSDLVLPRQYMSEQERLELQQRIVVNIILRHSPKSYLGRNHEADGSISPNVRFRYERRFENLVGVKFDERECLKDVHLVVFQGFQASNPACR